ncbi:MAG: GFA family protein [Hyphomicrobium sp.]|uniref:GFA family protein n=1 Tax=Hyphomicrobium sp. TaxID=82 RepID=UPI0039E26BB8
MKAKATPVSGGCLCGRIRYEAEAFLDRGYACHCSICQKSTGQPAEITVLIKAGTLRYLNDVPKYYVSSSVGKRGFCSECGSRIVWQASDPRDDWMTNLCVGSLDRPSEAKIACHMYADTQLPWYKLCEDLPKFCEQDFDAMMEFIRVDQ